MPLTDIVDSATRSKMMASIKGKNTKPEVEVRRFLHTSGLRFRLHCKDLPSKPDLVFPKWKTVVLVHGCFWHRHRSCRFATNPSSRAEFWQGKFMKNVSRDERQVLDLEALGWKVLVIWECEVKDPSHLHALREAIVAGRPEI